MAKSFANTFLYNKYPKYEKQLMDFIMRSERIDVNSKEFEDVFIDVKKRQISSSLVQVLKSKNVVLCTGQSISQQFKVVTCKDVKTDKKIRTFIDVSGVVYESNGVWVCDHPDILISYIVSAMTSTIYYLDPTRITNNYTISDTGAMAFGKLFCHVLEYIHKISTIPGLKGRAMYMCAMYYLVCILEKDAKSERTSQVARKIAGISEREEEIINMMCNENTYTNIKFFVESLSDVLKVGTLTIDMILEKWMYLFGVSTVFALELFPSFAQMLTDAYVGSYLNNQKTIEKVCGGEMVAFTKAILEIGGRSV